MKEKKPQLIDVYQLDNGDQSYLLVPKSFGLLSEDAKRLSDLTEEELCLLKATPRVEIAISPRSFSEAWGCEPHEDFYGPWGSREFGLTFNEEGELVSHKRIGVHNNTNTFSQWKYDDGPLWTGASKAVTFPREGDFGEDSYYEHSPLEGVHAELNRQLGWLTIDHGYECSVCGAPWGPLCRCCYDPEGNLLHAEQVPEGQPREFFEINVSQLFARFVDNLPLGTRVLIYPAEGKIEVK